jgi:hypothetical protein
MGLAKFPLGEFLYFRRTKMPDMLIEIFKTDQEK